MIAISAKLDPSSRQALKDTQNKQTATKTAKQRSSTSDISGTKKIVTKTVSSKIKKNADGKTVKHESLITSSVEVSSVTLWQTNTQIDNVIAHSSPEIVIELPAEVRGDVTEQVGDTDKRVNTRVGRGNILTDNRIVERDNVSADTQVDTHIESGAVGFNVESASSLTDDSPITDTQAEDNLGNLLAEQLLAEQILVEQVNLTAAQVEQAVKNGSDTLSQPKATGSKNKKKKIGLREMSIKELRDAANKIISGEAGADEMGVDIKGEVGELLRLIVDAKNKVDDIDPALHQSQSNVPYISTSLQEVNETTEKATIDLMNSAQNMQLFYKFFESEIEQLKTFAIAGKDDQFKEKYDQIMAKLNDAVELGFKVLEALEFQDITEQKIRKVIKSMQEMGSRLGAIIGYLHINGNKENKSAKDIEKLLSDYGLS